MNRRHRGIFDRHPRQTDALIAAGYAIPAAAVTALLVLESGPPTPATATALVVGTLPPLAGGAALLFRRRAPMAVLVFTTGMMLVTFSRPGDFASVAVACALYSTAVYRSATTAWAGFGAASVALLLVTAAAASPADEFWATGQIVLVLAVGVLLGIAVSNRRRYVRSLIENAERLTRERDQQALIAAAAERASIAREMHDIVSHSLSVMVTLAHGAAEVSDLDPRRASGAMRQVAHTGTTALSDLRRMLGVLHGTADASEDAAMAPQPGVVALPELVERFGSAGLPVTLTSRGMPPQDPGQQLAVYRLVQEALTNSLKHATGASEVTVALDYDRRGVTLLIDDDGRAPRRSDPPGGRGLIGMNERVALYGGSLAAGPRPDGGWRVRAQFPPSPGSAS